MLKDLKEFRMSTVLKDTVLKVSSDFRYIVASHTSTVCRLGVVSPMPALPVFARTTISAADASPLNDVGKASATRPPVHCTFVRRSSPRSAASRSP